MRSRGRAPDGLGTRARTVGGLGDGDSWATVAGPPRRVSRAFAVPSTTIGTTAARRSTPPHQASVPASLTDDVAELGRIMGYTPYRESVLPHMPRDVPNQGLLPTELLTTYGVNSLLPAALPEGHRSSYSRSTVRPGRHGQFRGLDLPKFNLNSWAICRRRITVRRRWITCR